MKVFTKQYLSELLAKAKKNFRLRAHLNLHHTYDEPCQKLFNAVGLGSYIPPHRHFIDPKSECLLAVKGLFALIVFFDNGEIDSITIFGSEKYSDQILIAAGVELTPSIWHTVISLIEDSILFEVKNGPFNPEIAKEFAPWAPQEMSENASQYFEDLRCRCLSQLSKMKIQN